MLLVAFFVLMVAVTISPGCANIIPPSGGPRDSLPPTLVLASPPDSTVNFSTDRITLTFDEYVDLQDVQNNLLFTPIFETNPEVSVRLKTITVRFRDTLLPNTTYILNFGSAVRDINENNVLKNFTYTFSTGPYLDTLTLAGNVLLAETGEVDSTLMVVLHRNLDDSAVMQKAPVYVARLDANGNFLFTNLPRDTFAIYALGEAGLSRRYQSRNQLFAFADEPVVAGSTTNLTLYAYREQAQTPAAPTPPQTTGNTADRRLRFTTPSGDLDLQSNYKIRFASPLKNFDSTGITLSTDSSFSPVAYTTLLDSSRTELTVRSKWQEGTAYNLILNRDFAEDSSGRKLLKTDTLNFSTKSLRDYGQLRIRIRNIDLSRNPVLQFIQNNAVVFSAPLLSEVYTRTLVNPGEYQLRLFYDANNNGQWDAGSFFESRRQPEKVQPIQRSINIKPAFDNEFEISL